MVSDRALYWMSVGTLALVAGNSLATRHGDWISCLGERSLGIAQRVTDRATSIIDRGDALSDRTEQRINQGQLVAVRLQTRLAAVQTRLARQQTALVRLQADKVRMISLTAMKQGMACAHKNVVVDVSGPDVDVSDDSQ